jgi:hypothetical protein
MYIFGGINQKLNPMQDLWVCSENYLWSQISISGLPANYGGIPFLLDNLLCFYGGTDGKNLIKTVIVINISNNTHHVVDDLSIFNFDHPELENEHLLFPQGNWKISYDSGIVHECQMYIIGGRRTIPELKNDKNSKSNAVEYIETYFDLDKYAKEELKEMSFGKIGSLGSFLDTSTNVKRKSLGIGFNFKSGFDDSTEFKF